jgi:predicted TIM-barrel fold metal-dependent hydrolase
MRSVDLAVREVEFGAQHGLHVRGVEHGYFLDDPYFYPIYEAAEAANLAIFVHVGASHRRIGNQPIGKLIATPPLFMEHVHHLMAGFHAVVASDLHERFPRLRWGFVEGGATWVLPVLQQHSRLFASGNEFLSLRPLTPDELEAKNIFVAVEVDEDIPYLIGQVGENVLCTGTDYGHNDVGSELAAHASILARSDISPEAARKIVSTNGRNLVGLPAGDPAPQSVQAVPDRLPNVRGASTSDGNALLTSARPQG